MTLNAYSIRDQKAEIFHVPHFKLTHGEAERDFRQLVNDEKSKLNKFPEDYDLYFVGTYDDQTGVFKPLSTPQHVIKAVMCLAGNQPSAEQMSHIETSQKPEKKGILNSLFNQ